MGRTIPHATLLASPGYGHLIPIIELGKRLVTHGFKVTVFAVPNSPSLLLPAGNGSVDVVVLPYVDVSGEVAQDAGMVRALLTMLHESLPPIRSAIAAMEVPPTVLIVDMFGAEAFAIADEFGVQKYVYITSNARFLALTLYLPVLDKEMGDKDEDFAFPLQIPGCAPLPLEDAAVSIRSRRSQMCDAFVRFGLELLTCDGILINTWEDLEPAALSSLRNNEIFGSFAVRKPIYPVGPIIKVAAGSEGQKSSAVLEWLDMQPGASVLYVSFGTGGTLSSEQTIELAWGLELSGKRFIWVLRPPTESDQSAAYFQSGKGGKEPSNYLPEGFLTRTGSVGMVIPKWASQQEILSHRSVGGFLTHCGWNSSLESIMNGVPVITWPLYAEQKMNSTLLSEEFGVGIKPTAGVGVVGREEIEKVVRMMIDGDEGEAMRSRARQLKCSGEKALAVGGSSHASLSHFAKVCQSLP